MDTSVEMAGGEFSRCELWAAALVEHGLLDHVVCPQQEWLGDRESEGLGGLEIDHQIEPGRLLDGQVGGLCALDDLVHEERGPVVEVALSGAVGQERAGIGVSADPGWAAFPDAGSRYGRSCPAAAPQRRAACPRG
jgi:hypothetical protein